MLTVLINGIAVDIIKTGVDPGAIADPVGPEIWCAAMAIKEYCIRDTSYVWQKEEFYPRQAFSIPDGIVADFYPIIERRPPSTEEISYDRGYIQQNTTVHAIWKEVPGR